MSLQENVIKQISDFLMSDEKGMLITGTHQFKKHRIVMHTINKIHNRKLILLRTNSMGMVKEHLKGLMKRQPKAGERFKLGNNVYEFDSFNTSSTWHKTNHNFSIVIVYPIDAIARGDVSMECIEDLFQFKEFDKIIFISWTDNLVNDYSKFDKYVNRKCVYDADDTKYHERVLETIHTKGL